MRLDFSNQDGKKIVINEKTKTNLVPIKDIIYLVCDSYITTCHLINNESISTAKLLKHFEQELVDYGFLRVNFNTVVNVKHITKIVKVDNKKFITINNYNIRISRRRSHLLKQFICQ
jgi:DNA-binding LytR/AlgR family response regulator